MYGIKVWLSKNDKDWYLLRDLNDGIVHIWDRRVDVEYVRKNLKCIRSQITKIMSKKMIERAQDKRKKIA